MTKRQNNKAMTKYEFTQSQYDEIRLLLKRRATESRDEQKKTRGKIRKLGFMISDYFNGFNENDFKKLLDKGEIVIVDKSILTKPQIIKKANANPQKNASIKKTQTAESKTKDEHYILALCDKIFGIKSYRQHKFDFLLGDPNKKGVTAKLPVDSYYQDLNLVVEYRERQHTESVNFFDKPNKMTVSGVHRGEQRRIYDERRRKILPKHNIDLIEISVTDFNYDTQKRIIRNPEKDIEIVKQKLQKYLPNDK
jgi:hypothetical protein